MKSRSTFPIKGMKPETLKLLKLCLFRELKSKEIKSVDDITQEHVNQKCDWLIADWMERWAVHMEEEKPKVKPKIDLG